MSHPRLRFVYHRIAHHGRRSGYDRLVREFPEARRVSSRPPSHLLAAFARRALLSGYYRGLAGRTGVTHYAGDEFQQEAQAAAQRLFTRGVIYHFLYGDSQFCWSGRWRLRRNTLVATFHNPPAVHRALLRDDAHLEGLDAAIAIGRSQLPLLAERVGPSRVHHVPHGVDTDFFCPASARPLAQRPLILFVGHYLRDFGTLRAALSELSDDGLEVVAITGRDAWSDLEGLGATLRTGLDDLELRDLYRRATLTLLPLHAGTANNALLESIACGTPVVASDVGDIGDYGAAGALLAPRGDVLAHVEAVRRLVGDADLRARLSAAARARALELAWPRVANQLRAVYQGLAP